MNPKVETLSVGLMNGISINSNLRAIFEVESIENMSHMTFNRPFGNIKLLGNFAVGTAIAN